MPEAFWEQRLLHAPVTESDRQLLPELVREEGRAFLEGYDRAVYENNRQALDAWYLSARGQAELLHWAGKWWTRLTSHAERAMPAHDTRHALCRVPAAAVECIRADDVGASARVSLFAALLHDQGRWAEERLFGNPTESVFHARLSFVLAREMLEKTAIPKALADEILYAVLTHTSGADASDPLVARITVTADRDQLHGPEFILRSTHHLAMPPHPTCVYDEAPGTSLIHRAIHMPAICLPAPMPWMDARHHRMQPLSLAFGLVALNGEAIEQSLLQKCPSSWMAFASTLAQRWNQGPGAALHDPVEQALELIDAPQVCPSPLAREKMVRKLEQVAPHRRAALARALGLMVQCRKDEEVRLGKSLKEAQQAFEREGDSLAAWLSATLASALT